MFLLINVNFMKFMKILHKLDCPHKVCFNKSHKVVAYNSSNQ